MRTVNPPIWRPEIATPMDIIECYGTYVAARGYEFKVGAPPTFLFRHAGQPRTRVNCQD